MASAKLWPCAMAAKGLRLATPTTSVYLLILQGESIAKPHASSDQEKGTAQATPRPLRHWRTAA
jgi:hypothetical protein